MIKSGFRKQKRYAVDAAGDKQLVSTWTSTDTVYDGEGMDMTTLLATKTVPQATAADNDKTLNIIDGAWTIDDCKVKQTQIISPSSSAWYEVLFSGTAGASTLTEGVNKYTKFQYSPYDNAIRILGNVTSTTIKPREIVLSSSGGSYTEIYNGTATIGYQGIDMTITGEDITLSDADSNNNTWDGTNTSLKTALAGKLSTSGGTITGDITMDIGQIYTTTLNFNHTGMNKGWGYLTLSDSQSQLYLQSPTNSHSIIIGAWANDVDIINDTKWDGTHTSLKDALAAATSNDDVLQTETTSSDSMYELLFSGTATNETLTESTRKHSELLYNPYHKALVIKNGLDPITEIAPGQISMTNVSGTTPPQIIISGETVDLKLLDTDIQFTGSTWDGIHTSLKDTISYIISRL